MDGLQSTPTSDDVFSSECFQKKFLQNSYWHTRPTLFRINSDLDIETEDFHGRNTFSVFSFSIKLRACCKKLPKTFYHEKLMLWKKVSFWLMVILFRFHPSKPFMTSVRGLLSKSLRSEQVN